MQAVVLPSGPSAHEAAAQAFRGGGLIVYPTDTVYGLGCDPLNERAVRRLFAAKGRGAKAVPVLCSGMARVEALVDLGRRGRELAEEHWPGALTIVAPLVRRVPELLNQGSGFLGVRIPGSRACVDLIESCGGILAGTSANLSGRPSCRSAEEARVQLGALVDLIIDGGRLGGQESTVVKVSGDEIIVLRKGAVGVSHKEDHR